MPFIIPLRRPKRELSVNVQIVLWLLLIGSNSICRHLVGSLLIVELCHSLFHLFILLLILLPFIVLAAYIDRSFDSDVLVGLSDVGRVDEGLGRVPILRLSANLLKKRCLYLLDVPFWKYCLSVRYAAVESVELGALKMPKTWRPHLICSFIWNLNHIPLLLFGRV